MSFLWPPATFGVKKLQASLGQFLFLAMDSKRERSRSPLGRSPSDKSSTSETLDLETCLPRSAAVSITRADDLSASSLFAAVDIETPKRDASPEEPSSWTRFVERPLAASNDLEFRQMADEMISKELQFDEAGAENGSGGHRWTPYLGEPANSDVRAGWLLDGPDAKTVLHRGLLPPILDPDDLAHKPILSWRPKLLADFKPGFDDAVWKRPVKVASLCCGTGAARLGLEWMGVPVSESIAADPKRATKTFTSNLGHQPDFFFDTAADVAQGQGFCHIHGSHQVLPLAREDLLVAGFPCQPFSTQRPGRFSDGWQSHPQTQVMHEVSDAIVARLPFLMVLENVLGFLRKARTRVHC